MKHDIIAFCVLYSSLLIYVGYLIYKSTTKDDNEMRDNFIHSDLAVCPNEKYHGGWECWRITGDNTYKCDCGCEFEWYAEDAWFIIKHGSKTPRPAIECSWFDNRKVQTFALAIFIVLGMACFLAFVIAAAIPGR